MEKETKGTGINNLTSADSDSNEYFELIYTTYSNSVFKYAFKSLKCKSEADDIVQQTFIQLWQSRKKFESIRSPKDYIFIVSRNLIFARLKEILKNESLSEELKLHTQLSHNRSEEDLVYSDIEKIAREAIEALPKQRKLIFKLSKEKDYTLDEIAERLSISKNTVKESLRQAHNQIRAKLSLDGDIILNRSIILLPLLYY